jgi:hypothetical protein
MHLATYQHSSGTARKVYRDASARRAKTLGRLLTEGLGACSLSVKAAMKRESDKHAELRRLRETELLGESGSA